MNNIIIFTGGTGGHLFPSQLLSNELKFKNINIAFICDQRVTKFINIKKVRIATCIILILSPKNEFIKKINLCINLIINILIFYIICIYKKIIIFIVFGSYIIIPGSIVAIFFNVPLLLHEQNIVVGAVNKILIPFSYNIITSFCHYIQINKKYYLKNKTRTYFKEFNYKKLAVNNFIKRNTVVIFIVGGSQAAELFNYIIPNSMLILKKNIQFKFTVLHQLKVHLSKKTKLLYKSTYCKYIIGNFFFKIRNLYNKSNILIMRGGGLSIKEIIVLYKKILVIPISKSRYNHQYLNTTKLLHFTHINLKKEKNFNSFFLSKYLLKLLYL